MIRSRPQRPAAARPRRGTVLPLVILTIVAQLAFLALAIDLGLVAIAKTQVQQAADLVSLTAARSLNGVAASNYNQNAATTNANNILSYNYILGKPIAASQLQLTFGSYDYNQSSQTFSASFPGLNGSPTTAITATITAGTFPAAFSSILGKQLVPSFSATAQAVHRPRDIALVMDLSGSMRMGTLLGFDFYQTARSTNNADSAVPAFSHYSSSSAGLQGPSSDRTSGADSYTIPTSNTTATTTAYNQTYITNFFQNAAYASTLIRAFDSYTSADGGKTWSPPSSGTPQLPPASYSSVPGGDVPLFLNGSTTTYAKTVKDVLGSSTRSPAWELDGYSNYTSGSLSNAAAGQSNYTSAPFYGYTQGPGYYGKTFFIWPPDPRQPLTTAADAAQINKFLTDFGYTTADFSGSTTGPPLYGIYGVTSTSGSQNWPWPNDGGSTLSTYLTTKVSIPGGSRKLRTTDSQYQQIMRLYSWNYVVDNLGTTPCDWRLRFFGTVDNTKLFDSSGDLNLPGSSTYKINYTEILRWLTQSPNPFPSQLRAGGVKYYGSIPTTITGSWPKYGNTDQRFWVEFIDHVLGLRQTSAGVYQDVSDMVGYGADFVWGTIGRTAVPSATQYMYMSYTDNPQRPSLRFWFSPILMVDYLHNYNMDTNVANYFYMQPGDSYEAPLYTMKEAYAATISTVQNNHPNDTVTVVPYSWPRSSWNATTGRFNCVRSPLGTNYTYASAAITKPFSAINADGSSNQTEVTPYDPDPATGMIPSGNFNDIPRADGDTCFAMALMLCYNQLAVTPASDGTLRNFVSSSPITFPTGMAGGLGRKGSQKVIIFETDGLPNCLASASLVSAGTYKYYKIRYDMNNPGGSEYPSVTASTINNSSVLSQIYSLIRQLSTDYSTTRNPFRLYALGFGPVFQGPNASGALSTLQSMQYYAGTQSSPSTPLAANQVVTGTDAQMSANMVSAFTSILESGVQIALIK